MEFQYKGMTFIYHTKPNKNGHIFEHILSGHGFYDKSFFTVWGRPTKEKAKEVMAHYVETMPSRLKTLLTYKTKYPEHG